MATCKKCGLTDLSSIREELCSKGGIESIPKAKLSCFSQDFILLFHMILYCHFAAHLPFSEINVKKLIDSGLLHCVAPDIAPEQLHPEK